MKSIEDIGMMIRAIRSASQKYRIKTYLLNCIYFAYLYNDKDSSKYLNRYVLGFSIALASIYSNVIMLVKFNLIDKVASNTFLLTGLSNEVCNYIDKHYTLLSSK